MKRVLVSAGDPSGDLILAALVRAIKASPVGNQYEFAGLCGPASMREGVQLVAEAKDVAVVGISEVVRKLPQIFGALGKLRQELSRCDSVLCVDFPDFNLKLADIARVQGKPVDYIIAPQVWAWRHGRLPKIARSVRRLYPALPFEEELFREAGVDAHFLGHPIRDMLPPRARRESRTELQVLPAERLLCLMPGSRRTEIERHLPLFLEAWDIFTHLEANAHHRVRNRAVLPLAPGWTREAWLAILSAKDRARFEELEKSGEWILASDSRRALMAADFGWIVSGTATLEAALYMLPHILVYRLSYFSALLIKSLSHYFSDRNAAAGLPNILLGQNVIPELLQDDVDARRLAIESFELLNDPARLSTIGKSLRYLPKKLGDVGAVMRISADLLQMWGAGS
ncbi:MAG: lipid-A-disaccharide synthase [Bdellovibrionales bacterium]|nr:lipid-A-disaccharide synthase [Bdellovibrionales bacterium]